MFRLVLATLVVAASCTLSPAQNYMYHIPVPQNQGPIEMLSDGRYRYFDREAGRMVFEDPSAATMRREAEMVMQMRMRAEISNQVQWEMWQQRNRAERALDDELWQRRQAERRQAHAAPALPYAPGLPAKAAEDDEPYPEYAHYKYLIRSNLPKDMSPAHRREFEIMYWSQVVNRPNTPTSFRGKKVYDPPRKYPLPYQINR